MENQEYTLWGNVFQSDSTYVIVIYLKNLSYFFQNPDIVSLIEETRENLQSLTSLRESLSKGTRPLSFEKVIHKRNFPRLNFLDKPTKFKFITTLPFTIKIINKIYHYTNLEGLKGIINSQSIWHSHALYLNDKDEIKVAKDKLENLFNNYDDDKVRTHFEKRISEIGESNCRERRKIDTPTIDDVMSQYDKEKRAFQDNNQPYYIASFTKKEDSLAHWALYGKNGKGICIECALPLSWTFFD